MKPRRVIVYMVVFALIGCSYYFFDVRPSKQAGRAEEARSRIFDLDDKQMAGFVLRANGVEFRIVRANDGSWRLMWPIDTPADRDAVEDLIRAALDARKQRTVTAPGSPDEYRLDPAPIVLTILTGAGTAGPPLLLGDLTPAGDGLYGRSGDSREIFTVSPGLRQALNRTLIDLRDKSVVLSAVETIDRIVIHGPQVVELRKKGVRNWEIVSPEPGPADDAAVDRILYAGLKSKAVRFVGPDQASNTGLDDPKLRMEIFAGGQPAAEIALGGIGPAQPEPGFWIKSSQHPELLIVEPKAATALRVELFELMERHVLNLDFRNLSAVNLIKGQTRMRAEKIRDIWDVVEPADAPDGDRRIARLIAALADLRHVRQLDDQPETLRRLGLDSPDLSITLKGPEEEAVLAVGLSPVEEIFLAVRSGRGPAVLIKPDDLLPALPGEIGPVKIHIEPADASRAADK